MFPIIPAKRLEQKIEPQLENALKKLAEVQAKIDEMAKHKASPGPAGKDGQPGKDGRDGKDADMAAIQKMIDAGFAKIKVVNGKDGRDGADGKDGKPGLDGKPGRDGKDGANGKDGKDADVAALQAEIAALRAQKFTAELYDTSGALLRRVQFGRDEPLKIFLLPVK